MSRPPDSESRREMPDARRPHRLVAFLGRSPSPWLRKAAVMVLMRTFARAFGVEAPRLAGLAPNEALRVYREFTAACMEMAAGHEGLARHLRARLGKEAQSLGRRVRGLLRVPADQTPEVARLLYCSIGIELTGKLPGELRFGPCSFSERYTPHDCWCMSAFDEGFLQGLSGHPEARLLFSSRLTEDAPCCLARFDVP